MMKFVRILRKNFVDSLKGIIRNYSLSFATIWSITITLLVVAVSMILSYNVNNFTDLIKKDVTIVAFVDVKATEEENKNINDSLKNISNINTVSFFSRDEAASTMKDESEILGNIFNNWEQSDNPLRDSYIIKVKDVEQISKTAEEIKKIDKIYTVKYGEGMIDQLLVVFKVTEKIAFILVISLVLVTAFLIGNTIKLTIYSRKREIEIMRLVGASNTVINMPFVIEGILLGLLGSIIPIIATIYGYNSLYTFFNGNLFSPIIKLVPPMPFALIISLILVLMAMIVGAFGSIRAVRRHLKI